MYFFSESVQLEAKLFKLAAQRLETYFTSLTLPVLRNNGTIKQISLAVLGRARCRRTPRSAGQIIRTHMDLSLERYSNMYQIKLI